MKITRSFSKKIQIRQFEPIEFFCAAEQECELEDVEKASALLDKFVQAEVAKSESLWERIKPIPKFETKKDYNKLYEPKHEDVGKEDAELESDQFAGKGEKSFQID